MTRSEDIQTAKDQSRYHSRHQRCRFSLSGSLSGENFSPPVSTGPCECHITIFDLSTRVPGNPCVFLFRTGEHSPELRSHSMDAKANTAFSSKSLSASEPRLAERVFGCIDVVMMDGFCIALRLRGESIFSSVSSRARFLGLDRGDCLEEMVRLRSLRGPVLFSTTISTSSKVVSGGSCRRRDPDAPGLGWGSKRFDNLSSLKESDSKLYAVSLFCGIGQGRLRNESGSDNPSSSSSCSSFSEASRSR